MDNEDHSTKGGDNFLAKLLDGVIGWGLSLVGKKPVKPQTLSTKPSNSTINVSQKTPGTKNGLVEIKHEDINQEDSIAKDLDSVKILFGKMASRVSEKVAPGAAVVKAKTSEAVTAGTKKMNFSWVGKLIPILLAVSVIMIAGLLLLRVFKSVQNGIGNGDGNGRVTPTPVAFQPQTPSIYFDDADILKLEEELNVLAREIQTKVIRESDLNPPRLDFNINF